MKREKERRERKGEEMERRKNPCELKIMKEVNQTHGDLFLLRT